MGQTICPIPDEMRKRVVSVGPSRGILHVSMAKLKMTTDNIISLRC